ncbi:Lpg1974 family pore-forming outer membrane protein [Legionella quateirensis]|uniref:Major outer membrane protein n=1 Tax=Legionella quateirensis TaxID=45072 RepID=A0A378KQJ2_9GAMM|nr:Lpg1974 family pore-forming outer membrane protein [Legionella quateirensis]KTD42359.1 major outer membrane protein [Legionella quateirensis]STY17154.1 major outer membrane protein [Legionella quateirensis]
MFKLKGIAVAVLIMNCSISFSGSMGPICESGKVQIPCGNKAWSFGGAALYLQPAFGGNGLGYTAYSNYSGNDNNGVFIGTSGAPNQMVNIGPKWGWGFQINGAYQFKANDLVVNWYHLNSHNKGNFPVGYAFAGNNDGFYASEFQVRTNWDEVDIEFGQHLQLPGNKLVRLHAGAEFGRIKNQFDNISLLHPTSVVAYTTTDTLSYNGFGPRLGIDLGYMPVNSLELYAKMAGSMLIGTAKQRNSGYQNYPYPNNPISPFVTGNYNQTLNGVIVPELAAKLGAQYDWKFEQNILSFDIGYMWMNYLNSIISYSGNGIVFANVGNNSTANFNLNGMYLGLKLTGNT